MIAANRDVAVAKALTERLKSELAEKTANIVAMPDGRTKVGDTVSGKPELLQKHVDEMQSLYRAKQYDEAFKLASRSVKDLEDSIAIEKTAYS